MIFFNCKKDVEKKVLNALPKIEIKSLYKINASKVKKRNDSLIITLHDDSYIYFPEYVETKADYFIYENYNSLKDLQFEGVKVNFIQIDRPEIFSYNYGKIKIDSIHKQIDKNKYLNRNLKLIVCHFTLTELWNFRNLVKQASEQIGDNKIYNHIELVKKMSEKQLTEKNKSVEYRRVRIIRNYLKENKITDFWNQKNEVSSVELVKKLNLMLDE